MTERELSDAVHEVALLLGWLGYHTYDSRRSNAGFPDWVFVRGGRLLFVELKGDRGRFSPEQERWLSTLAGTCAEVYRWRPTDWLSGEVVKVLRVQGFPAQAEDMLSRKGTAG